MTSLRTSKEQSEHYSVTMASLPPLYAYDWYLQYARRWGLSLNEKPSADQWCCVWNGERQRVVAVSGETFNLRHNTIKILHLLAEPSRDGVRASINFCECTQNLSLMARLLASGETCIAANSAMAAPWRKAGISITRQHTWSDGRR